MTLAGGEMEAQSLAAGDIVDVGDIRATVLAVGARGPTRVAFRFDRTLDDPSLTLLGWRRGALRAIRPPPIGQALTLERHAS